MKRKYTVGDIVCVTSSFLGEPANVRAYVYDEYNVSWGHGVSIITEDGVDLGGFSDAEQDEYLEFVRKSGHYYSFKNVMQLSWHFEIEIKPLFINENNQ